MARRVRYLVIALAMLGCDSFESDSEEAVREEARLLLGDWVGSWQGTAHHSRQNRVWDQDSVSVRDSVSVHEVEIGIGAMWSVTRRADEPDVVEVRPAIWITGVARRGSLGQPPNERGMPFNCALDPAAPRNRCPSLPIGMTATPESRQ